MTPQVSHNNLRRALILLLGIMATLGIILLKRTVNRQHALPLPSETVIAIPDTTLSTPLPALPADTTPYRTDSFAIDHRPPYEAGYEDGYFNGMDDGSQKDLNATYDESSTFPAEHERTTYTVGYREGYRKGFSDGSAGKQFNI